MKALRLLMLCTLSSCAATDNVPYIEEAQTAGIFLDLGGRDTLAAGVALRPIYEKGLGVTKSSEGFRAQLYEDVARYCTIGYGHLIKRAPCNGTEAPNFLRGLSEPEGTVVLTSDMAGAQRVVQVAVEVDLNDAQFAALCDFVFNVGPTNFKNSALLRAVNAGEFDRVPAQMRRWTLAGGKAVKGLANRREAEIRLFFDGSFVPRGAPGTGEDLSPLDILPHS